MSRAPVAIVDPYSAGSLLAEALVGHDVPCVAIESSCAHPASMKPRYQPDTFIEVIGHDGDLDRTLQQLGKHAPTHVMAGFESGVELADLLSDRLGLPANDPDLRAARRDKFLMIEAAKRHGLRTALQYRSSNVEELLGWIREALDWPVIVKPPKSVASDHVFRCRNSAEVRHAARAILSGLNVLGARNPVAIAQEFIEGTEYVVDMVSVDARPKLTAVWQYDRPAGTREFICYDAMRLLPYSGRRQAALHAYAVEVNKALGIRFGPSHCEMIWQDDEPVLVEIGARLTGGVNAVLSRQCSGVCQLDETVTAILDPAAFLAGLGARPVLRQHVVNVFLPTPRKGTLVRARHVEDIKALPTVHSMSVANRSGVKLKHVSGLITLISPDPGAIDRDLEIIRSYERDGIFEVQDEDEI